MLRSLILVICLSVLKLSKLQVTAAMKYTLFVWANDTLVWVMVHKNSLNDILFEEISSGLSLLVSSFATHCAPYEGLMMNMIYL